MNMWIDRRSLCFLSIRTHRERSPVSFHCVTNSLAVACLFAAICGCEKSAAPPRQNVANPAPGPHRRSEVEQTRKTNQRTNSIADPRSQPKIVPLPRVGDPSVASASSERTTVTAKTVVPSLVTLAGFDSPPSTASPEARLGASDDQPSGIVRLQSPPPQRLAAAPPAFFGEEHGMPRGLHIPQNLPGANAPPITFPPPGNKSDRLAAIDKLFPDMPKLPPPVQPLVGPGGRPLTLAELESYAVSDSPVVRQAIADLTATRGNAIQMGLHPNPTVGYEGDTIGSAGNSDYHGAYFTQEIKTAGKLQLQQEAAMVDYRNAQLAVRKARIAIITQVQAGYYAVLVAEEGVRTTEALTVFTDEVYRVQVEQLHGGEAAAYEPMQLRVLAMQARGLLIQARNRYYSAWKQLAATMNQPNMPPTQLAGNLDIKLPVVHFEPLKAQMWEYHTDILAARNSELQARINLRFEEVTPIPDLYIYFALQKDYTNLPNGSNLNSTSFNTQIGLPLPFYDRNQGGIMQAQGLLVKALQQAMRMRNDLTVSLSDAFERYENNRLLLDFYRVQMLPDQARAYRGVYTRHQQQPDRVSFGDIVQAQQTLANAINAYIMTLNNQWIAATDLLNVVQVEDISDLIRIDSRAPTLVQAAKPPPTEAPAGEPVQRPPPQ
jgi:cobalt-zinc-cadmium efflux system outer membrane protein